LFSGEQARAQAAAAAEAAAAQQAAMAAVEAEAKQEVIVEPSSGSSIDLSEYSHRVVSFLARNFYNLKYVALVLAFCINFMLLFYKVYESFAIIFLMQTQQIQIKYKNSKFYKFMLCIWIVFFLTYIDLKSQVSSLADDSDDEGSGRMADLLTEISGEGTSGLAGSGMEIGSGSGENGSEEEDEEPQEFVEVAEDYYYMAHVMRLLAAFHSIVSLAMLVAYYHLKVLEK